MTALILTIAVAAMLTPLILARPLVAIPGGLAATLAWWVAASASVGLMPGVAGVAYTALGIGTAGSALAAARRGGAHARRGRPRRPRSRHRHGWERPRRRPRRVPPGARPPRRRPPPGADRGPAPRLVPLRPPPDRPGQHLRPRPRERARPMNDFEDLMTPAEVAAAFRVDPKTVSRCAGAERLTSVRTPGGHRRYFKAEVEALLLGAVPDAPAEQEPESASGAPRGPPAWCPSSTSLTWRG